jgi:hypothetical protein
MKAENCGLFAACMVFAAAAQAAEPMSVVAQPAPLVVTPATAQPTTVLPANTPVTLALNDTITTKGNRFNEGDNFDMTVTQDVRMGGYVIIPRGSRGVGRITWLTNKGAFGKSGKMEIDIEYAEVSGHRIPLSGHYRQEGEGNTVGTVAGVVAVGVFAGFVTGKSGVIPAGRELTARTKEDLPVVFAGPPPSTSDAFVVQAMSRGTPQPAMPVQNSTITAQKVGGVRCVTCR